MIRIRKGWKQSDLPRICLIDKQGAEDGAWRRYSRSGMKRHLEEQTVWVAREDGDILGYLTLREPHRHNPVPEIIAVGVLRCCRNAGIASRLMRAAERHARQQGASLMDLWVRNRNARAQIFYLRRGYYTTRIAPGTKFSVLLMTKQLRGKPWQRRTHRT